MLRVLPCLLPQAFFELPPRCFMPRFDGARHDGATPMSGYAMMVSSPLRYRYSAAARVVDARRNGDCRALRRHARHDMLGVKQVVAMFSQRVICA